MFGRTALRVAGRRTAAATRPPAFTPMLSRAAFNSSSKNSDPEIPVVSYQAGERQETVVQYDTNATGNGPVAPPGADEEKKARPLKPEALKHLTPTLQKFTLLGKVAVVTGYVPGASF